MPNGHSVADNTCTVGAYGNVRNVRNFHPSARRVGDRGETYTKTVSVCIYETESLIPRVQYGIE